MAPMRALMVLLFVFMVGTLGAEPPDDCLGMPLQEVFDTCGVPSEVFPLRGEEPWQDDVVFRYAADYSLFIFRDRVWQVRVWESGSLAGVALGASRAEVLDILGEPAGEVDGSLVFSLPSKDYPVRLRVIFNDDLVSDIYLYRADF